MAADWLLKLGNSITYSIASEFCFSTFFGAILSDDVLKCTLMRRCVSRLCIYHLSLLKKKIESSKSKMQRVVTNIATSYSYIQVRIIQLYLCYHAIYCHPSYSHSIQSVNYILKIINHINVINNLFNGKLHVVTLNFDNI